MTVREEGLSRYVGLSVGVHIAVVGTVLAFLWLGRHQEPTPPATFELVGIPGLAEGSAGAAEGGSSTSEPEAVPEEEPAPEPTPPEEPKAAAVLPEKSAKPEAKKADPAKKPEAAKPVAGSGNGNATGPGQGKGGTGSDTLQIGTGAGGGRAPSYMSAWLTRVRTLVERQWRAPDGAQTPKGAPVVVFSVARDGRPGRPVLASPSGNPLVDRLALRAVAAVETFPPPPDAWPKAEVKLRYVLEVRTP